MSRKTRKLIWSAPLVVVLAVAGALAIFAALTPGAAEAHDPPGVVTKLTAKADGTNSVKLTWGAPAGANMATSYRVDYSTDGHVWKELEGNVTGTAHTHMGADPGETYYYRVFAINSAGMGPMSEISSGDTEAGGRPGPVTGLKATRMGHNAIKLEWQAPAKNGGYDIMHYDIHAALTAGGSTGAIPDPDITVEDDDKSDGTALVRTMGAVLTYNFDGLTPGATWSFQVYAVNKNPDTVNNKSETAPTTRSASTAKQTKPSEPTGLLAVADGDDVKLYWYWPSDIGGADGDDVLFTVEGHHTASDDTVTDWTALAAYAQANTSTIDYTHTGPTEGKWKYRVSTVGGTADGLTSKTSLVSRTVTVPNVGTANAETVLATDRDAGKVTNAVLGQPMEVEVEETRGKIVLTWDKVEPPKGRVLNDAGTEVTTPAETHLRPTGYRIDVSTDGIMWHRVPASAQPTQLTKTVYSYDKSRDGLKLDASRFYRVFPQSGSITGPAQEDPAMAEQAATTAPSMVQSVGAVGISATEIRVTWEPPEDDGNANIEYYLIDYRSTASGSAAFPATHAAADSNRKMVKGTMRSYTHEVDMGGTEMQFRVFAKNTMENGCPAVEPATTPESYRCSPIATADVVTAASLKAEVPAAPKGLTAETAGITNLPGITDRGVLLLWNAPGDPAGGDVGGYTVQRMVVGTDTDFKALEGAEKVPAVDTYFTDTELPADGEMRKYRVRAYNNDEKPGNWSNTAYYPAAAHVPGKPTAVMAAKDADMPASKIKVSWSAPAMNAASVDGYIIERRYGDMMMDITSYNDGVMGAMHAFMDYKEWWETLDCDGMLQAANIAPASATDEQKGMYCKHFDSTAPTSMDFPADKEISDKTAMKVKDLFKMRYVVKSDDMGKTMTMFTGMMYTDMGLKADREYTYRVRAIHGTKAGAWSDTDMETTDSGVTTLTAPTGVGTCVGGDPGCPDVAAGQVEITWTDGMNADRHVVILFDSNWETKAAWIAGNQTDETTTFGNVPPGTYTAVVVAVENGPTGNAAKIEYAVAAVTVN